MRYLFAPDRGIFMCRVERDESRFAVEHAKLHQYSEGRRQSVGLIYVLWMQSTSVSYLVWLFTRCDSGHSVLVWRSFGVVSVSESPCALSAVAIVFFVIVLSAVVGAWTGKRYKRYNFWTRVIRAGCWKWPTGIETDRWQKLLIFFYSGSRLTTRMCSAVLCNGSVRRHNAQLQILFGVFFLCQCLTGWQGFVGANSGTLLLCVLFRRRFVDAWKITHPIRFQLATVRLCCRMVCFQTEWVQQYTIPEKSAFQCPWIIVELIGYWWQLKNKKRKECPASRQGTLKQF